MTSPSSPPKSPTFLRAVGGGNFTPSTIGDLTRGEYTPFRGIAAGVAIGEACLRQDAFREHVERLRDVDAREERQTVALKLAARYAQRGSPGHQVMWHVLLAAGEGPVDKVGLAVQVVWARPNRTDAHARRNKPGKAALGRWERGAELIARRGAGLCLVPGCGSERDRTIILTGKRDEWSRSGRQYCAAHFDPSENKPAAKIIEQTFAAAAAALPTVDELLTVWMLGATRAADAG
jgi:hypothetical protein